VPKCPLSLTTNDECGMMNGEATGKQAKENAWTIHHS